MSADSGLHFWPSQVLAAYHERRYEEVSERLLEVLLRLKTFNFHSLDGSAQHFVDVFVKHFLYLFTQEDYVPADRHMVQFVALNAVISNVVAMSGFRTTDAYIGILKHQAQNFAKLLALYSARNSAPLDRRMLFDSGPALATHWYFCFWESSRNCCAEKHALGQLREHLRFQDERMGAIDNSVPFGYFGCTYADCENDRTLKQDINRRFQQWAPAQAPILNRPDRRRIAVITEKWIPGHSVYRCTYSFVRALAAQFDLTLVHLGAERPDLDRSLFREVRRFQLSRPMDHSALSPNDWGIAYYPDIGMNAESIYLSNLRLAPIQICGYGHPVSTFGSRIDYWLGGRDIESIEDHEANYSERLVLVPGSGVAPNPPACGLQGVYAPGEVCLINCPWTSQKINYPLLESLRRILDRSRRRIRFRFFTGASLEGNAYVPFLRNLVDLLGAQSVELFDAMPYADYMAHMERGDFTLDSYPFGGYATATDSIFLAKPLIAWEGKKFYNRSAASLLRRLGLEELIARNAECYEALALRLIHNDAYRADVSTRLAGADLERTIFAHDDAKYVVKAFHYLIENHARLRADGHRRPIVIDGDDVPGSRANSPQSSVNQLLNRAETQRREGRLDQAEASYRQTLALRPEFPETHNNLGSLYLQLGRLDDAETSFRRALSHRADFPEAHYNLAIALQRRNCLPDAAASLRRALACRPDFAEAHNDLGRVYRLLGQMQEAEDSFRRAIASRPEFADAHHNLATALLMAGRLPDAEASLRQALALRPDLPGAHNNLGLLLAESGRLEEAEENYRKALALDPRDHKAAYNLSRIRMLLGDYDSGLKLYESRIEGGNEAEFGASRSLLRQLGGFPRWNGEEVRGKGLLIWTEQGLGDALMMTRYLPELKARGAARIAVICPPELARLMQALPAVDLVASQGTVPLAGLSWHCPIMSLPFAFQTRLASIPRNMPYLRVPADLLGVWRDKLSGVARPRIGIAWAGSAGNPRDRIRSVSLERFAALSRATGIRFINLQKGIAASEIGNTGTQIQDWMPECDDLLDTAALVGQLDLVISVDTAVAHLAGALGKPVWLLNRFESEWRWLLEREDSPWYPTVRLFRQKRAGDWAGVFQEIEAALRERLRSG